MKFPSRVEKLGKFTKLQLLRKMGEIYIFFQLKIETKKKKKKKLRTKKGYVLHQFFLNLSLKEWNLNLSYNIYI